VNTIYAITLFILAISSGMDSVTSLLAQEKFDTISYFLQTVLLVVIGGYLLSLP
jgi:hypothetical protein